MGTLAARTGITKDTVEQALRADIELPDYQIEALASELAVPIPKLFAQSALNLIPSVDFRTATPGIGEFEPGTLKAIAFVENLSSVLTAIDQVPALSPDVLNNRPEELTKTEANRMAQFWRAKWGISDEEQIEWRDANKLYQSLRSFIESQGIVVLHQSFKTIESAGMYLHPDAGPHVIVINTYQSSKARKVFTLGHEFAHVLLGKTGTSNPSVLRNRVEKFCNWFSARLLAPKRLIKAVIERYNANPNASDDFIRLFAQKLGISQEATFLRLVETGFLERSAYRSWKRKFANRFHIPTGDLGISQGGGRSDPVQNKITQFGTTLLGALRRAKDLGSLDEFEIQEISGLKPRFQNALFGEA